MHVTDTYSLHERERVEVEVFDREYYGASRPLLLVEGAASWRAVQSWTPAYLTTLLAHKQVLVKSNEQGVFDTNRCTTTGKVDVVLMTFARASELITAASGAGPRHYIQQRSIEKEFPELLPELELPALIDSSKEVHVANLWFGSAGCKSPLHFDESDNFLAQVFGSKRVMLYPPSCGPNLYPALGDRNPHCSRVNVFSPDLVRFPRYADAASSAVRCNLRPGNMLYIPKGWWHAVESLDVSISVNIWWGRKRHDSDVRRDLSDQTPVAEAR
jgi:hypothetical protein